MPNRIIKETIWTSPNLNNLSDLAERHFYRLLPLPDDHGCCELTPLVVKGRCYPLRQAITVVQIDKWNTELEENDLIRRWNEGGRVFGFFTNWSKHQRVRSLHQRKTPEPPSSVVNCCQVSSDDGLNPNPNPNPNLTTLSGKPDVHPLESSQTPPKGNGAFKAEAKEVIEFLNAKAGRKYRPEGPNLEFVVARLKEGYELRQLRGVIAKKCRDWMADEKMAQYLRPATLFNRTKFSQYIGEIGGCDVSVP